MGVEKEQVHQSGSGWSPVVRYCQPPPFNVLFCHQYMEDNLGVMSVGFLLSSPDDAVIWRGPKKNGGYWWAGIGCTGFIVRCAYCLY